MMVVSDDLESQMSALHDNAEKLTGRITPFVMEQILHEKLQGTQNEYQKQIDAHQNELDDLDLEIEELEKQVERERIISEALEKQKTANQSKIMELT